MRLGMRRASAPIPQPIHGTPAILPRRECIHDELRHSLVGIASRHRLWSACQPIAWGLYPLHPRLAAACQ